MSCPCCKDDSWLCSPIPSLKYGSFQYVAEKNSDQLLNDVFTNSANAVTLRTRAKDIGMSPTAGGWTYRGIFQPNGALDTEFKVFAPWRTQWVWLRFQSARSRVKAHIDGGDVIIAKRPFNVFANIKASFQNSDCSYSYSGSSNNNNNNNNNSSCCSKNASVPPVSAAIGANYWGGATFESNTRVKTKFLAKEDPQYKLTQRVFWRGQSIFGAVVANFVSQGDKRAASYKTLAAYEGKSFSFYYSHDEVSPLRSSCCDEGAGAGRATRASDTENVSCCNRVSGDDTSTPSASVSGARSAVQHASDFTDTFTVLYTRPKEYALAFEVKKRVQRPFDVSFGVEKLLDQSKTRYKAKINSNLDFFFVLKRGVGTDFAYSIALRKNLRSLVNAAQGRSSCCGGKKNQLLPFSLQFEVDI